MKSVWIISADKKEIPGIGGVLLKYPGTLYFSCGIGMFESFYNFSAFVNLPVTPPDGVILVGTAGSSDPGHLLQVNLTDSFTYPAFLSEVVPDFLYQCWKTKGFVPDQTKARYLDFPVYSTFGISMTTANNGEGMKEAWENMEALSLSFVCHKKEIPFMALLCCTNLIGSGARQEWRDNYQRAGEILISQTDSILGDLF